MDAKHVKIAVEMMGDEGPTGAFREVTAVAVRDYGGNEIWSGTAAAYRPHKYPNPTRIVATKVAPEVYRGHQIYATILANYADLAD